MGCGRVILQKLCELAYREGLLVDADYELKPVAGLFSVTASGQLIDFISFALKDDRGNRTRGRLMQIPRRSGRTGGADPDFLVDKSEYVLGIEPEGKSPARKPSELLERLCKFRDSVHAAFVATSVPALGAIDEFLASEPERERAVEKVTTAGYASNDLFAFEYDGYLVHEIPAVRTYFSGIRRATSRAGTRCTVCARVSPPVAKHPKVRIPGGTTAGVSLVSFSSDAFESYGLVRNSNAPVCRDCADAYTTALNRLLSIGYPDLRKPGKVLPRGFVRLSDDTTAVFWSERESMITDLLPGLFDALPETVKSLLEAASGSTQQGISNRFYCLVLSAVQGRAALRGMHVSTVEDLKRNMELYFEQIAISSELQFPLWRLLGSLVSRGEKQNLPSGLASGVFQAIVLGRPFPRTLLLRAVARCATERKVTGERAALVRGFVVRNRNWGVSVSLDTGNKDPGYRLGRLLAILERLQRAAQGNLEKTIVDQYYGAASTRPVVVFPRLIALAQHHLSKLRVGSHIFYQGLLGQVLEDLDGFKPTLSLEEQGLFAVGYYHQRQEFFRKPEAMDSISRDSGEQT